MFPYLFGCLFDLATVCEHTTLDCTLGFISMHSSTVALTNTRSGVLTFCTGFSERENGAPEGNYVENMQTPHINAPSNMENEQT